MFCSEILFLFICLTKMNVKKIYFSILMGIFMALLCLMHIMPIIREELNEGESESIVLIKCCIFIIVIMLVFFKNYQDVELLPLLIFMTIIWILIIAFSFKFYIFNDFKSLIAKDTLIILAIATI